MRRNDYQVSIESIRYKYFSGTVQILADNGDDITEEVEYATFGQQLVANGRALDLDKLKRMAAAEHSRSGHRR